MMVVSIISLVISCIVQSIFSNYLGYTYLELSIFSTLYVLINLLVLKPYFENEKKYLLLVVIFGFIMGICYTDAVIFNVFLFVFTCYFTKVFHFFFPYNLLTINISCVLSICLYHIVTFIFLFLLKYDYYTIYMLLEVLTHSILMTFVYTSLIYCLLSFLSRKLDLREIK